MADQMDEKMTEEKAREILKHQAASACAHDNEFERWWYPRADELRGGRSWLNAVEFAQGFLSGLEAGREGMRAENTDNKIVHQYPDGHLVESDSCIVCSENALREKVSTLRTQMDALETAVNWSEKMCRELVEKRCKTMHCDGCFEDMAAVGERLKEALDSISRGKAS